MATLRHSNSIRVQRPGTEAGGVIFIVFLQPANR